MIMTKKTAQSIKNRIMFAESQMEELAKKLAQLQTELAEAEAREAGQLPIPTEIPLPDGTVLRLPISQGFATLIDLEDEDLAGQQWFALQDANHTYATSGYQTKKKKSVSMHRIIMQRILGRPLAAGETVDHIDGDGLNNRRSNLRIATKAENLRNRGRNRNNSSGYKGVTFYKPNGKWMAKICIDYKQINLGYYDTPELASQAYKLAAIAYHGEFANPG